MEATAEITNYNLFGETAELADVVHCEAISTRSMLHDWQLSPHRHARLHQVLLVASGGGVARLEGREVPLGPGAVVNLPAGAVHGFGFEPGTEGWILTLPADLVDHVLRPAEGLWAVLRLPMVSQGAEALAEALHALFAEYQGRHFARAQMLRMMAGQVLAMLARHLESRRAEQAEAARPLFRRLEALIEARYAERPKVAEVAQALAVSSQHLGRVARAATGQPVRALLAERSHREARRLLTYTNLSVQQVAFRLGFSDAAHFSRVFSRQAGVSPRAFRAALERA